MARIFSATTLAAAAALFGVLTWHSNAAFAGTIIVNPGDDLKAAVEGASAGDVIELTKGTHVVPDTFCPAPPASCTLITIPGGVSIMADPAAPHGTVVIEGGSNSERNTLFGSTGTNITVSGLKFVPEAGATMGGRAVWVPIGGAGDLVFNDNIVDRFTDAVFAVAQTGGTIEFRNNTVTIVDRDPAANNGFLGGNAALTVLFANLESLDASGNQIHGPGRNVERFIAVVGLVIFNTTHTIETVAFWNNAVNGFDIGIFTSGEVGGGTGVTVAENRVHNNGTGIQAGQVPDPDITIPTPADETIIAKNRITGNSQGVFLDTNASNTTIEENQIAGNVDGTIIDNGTSTTIGENLIRGKSSDTAVTIPPALPPGNQFDPVTGRVEDALP